MDLEDLPLIQLRKKALVARPPKNGGRTVARMGDDVMTDGTMY